LLKLTIIAIGLIGLMGLCKTQPDNSHAAAQDAGTSCGGRGKQMNSPSFIGDWPSPRREPGDLCPGAPPNAAAARSIQKNPFIKASIKKLFLLPALIAGLVLLPAGRVTAQTFTNLYSFTNGSDGANPFVCV
jgi:hypothetical protein